MPYLAMEIQQKVVIASEISNSGRQGTLKR